MAMTRNQRRKLNRERAKAKALRLYERDKALQAEKVKAIVAENVRRKPERNYYAGTTSRIWCNGASASVSPQKHCEAKQRVTVYGKTVNLSGRAISKGKR